jgi:hypothetical protein
VAISAKLELLGVFEDRAQQEFVTGVLERLAPTFGVEVSIEARLTCGCRFDYLGEHLQLAPAFAGVVVGVDGARYRRAPKIAKLSARVSVPARTLWAIAEPSIEEWMMADAEALPRALGDLFGVSNVTNAGRPGHPRTEVTAKARLRDWVNELLGEPALQGGVEYAGAAATKVSGTRIGTARNPDFIAFLQQVGPFLRGCVENSSE